MSATQFRWCAANRPRPLKTIGIREISWETDCLEAEMRTRRLPGTCRYHRECIPPSWYVNAYGGEPPPLSPPPGDDSHHGPLPGASMRIRLFSLVQPLAPPHEFSRVAFRVRLAITPTPLQVKVK